MVNGVYWFLNWNEFPYVVVVASLHLLYILVNLVVHLQSKGPEILPLQYVSSQTKQLRKLSVGRTIQGGKLG